MSNEIAFCTLSMIHPVTYAVANTLKRSIVVASSLVSQPTPAAGGRGWRRGRELGPARRPLRAESFPHARAPALFVRPGVLSAESTPYWLCRRLHGDRRRLHILRVLRRSVIAGCPSRHLPLSPCVGLLLQRFGRFARRYTIRLTHPYGFYLFSREPRDPPCTGTLSSIAVFSRGFLCARLF